MAKEKRPIQATFNSVASSSVNNKASRIRVVFAGIYAGTYAKSLHHGLLERSLPLDLHFTLVGNFPVAQLDHPLRVDASCTR